MHPHVRKYMIVRYLDPQGVKGSFEDFKRVAFTVGRGGSTMVW